MAKKWPATRRPKARQLWAVVFWSETDDPDGIPHLCYGGWHRDLQFPRYNGEPARLVVFTTRRLAREYAETRNAEWSARKDAVRHWRMRVVRVNEIVTVVNPPRRRSRG